MSSYKHPCYLRRLCATKLIRARIGWVYPTLAVVFAITFFASTCLITLVSTLDLKSPEIPAFLAPKCTYIDNNKFVILSVLLFLQGVVGVARWLLRVFFDNWRVERKRIKKVLDDLVIEHFVKLDDSFVHRATLFAAAKAPILNWFLGQWLFAVCRSGSVYEKTGSIFSIDKQTRYQNTGCAGLCWFLANSQNRKAKFSVIKDSMQGESEADQYIRSFQIDRKEYDQMNVKSCFFLTVPVIKYGMVWGVIVVDTNDESVILQSEDKRRNQKKAIEKAANLITMLLED